MQIGDITIVPRDLFFLRIIIFVLSVYGAYENLIRKRLSLFGLDRFFYVIACFFDRNAVKKRMKNDPSVLKKMGIYLILFALGAVINCFTIQVNG